MKNIKTQSLVLLKNNPRTIKDDKYEKLKASIRDFPEMLQARPVVVNKEMEVLGGNMRVRAALELKIDSIPCTVVDWDEAKQKQFVIKDNVGFGVWDWDVLANEWNEVELKDWGLDVWQPEEDVDYSALDDLDIDGELTDKELGVKRAIQVEFDPGNYDEALRLINEYRKNGGNVGLVVLEAFRGA